MKTETKEAQTVTITSLTTLATVAALSLGPAWLGFITLAIGAGLLATYRSRYSLYGAVALALVLLLVMVEFGYGIGKDLAIRDNAPVQKAR